LQELEYDRNKGFTTAHALSAVQKALTTGEGRERLLVVADDCHWLDSASLRLLTALGQQLSLPHTLLIAATDAHSASSIPVRTSEDVYLEPLDATAANLVLTDRHGELATTVSSAVLATAEGNPLALVDLPAALNAAQRSGLAPLPDPLPPGPALNAALGTRFRALPTNTRSLLALLVLADETTQTKDLVRAAGQLGHDLDALAPAEAAGLITGERMPRFTRRIHRSLAYHTAPDLMQQRAWEAWAALALPQPGAPGAPPVSAHPAPDHTRHLQTIALSALRDRHFDRAARMLRRAADLTPDPLDRARLRVSAATACIHGGQPHQALALAREPASTLRADIRNTQRVVRASALIDMGANARENASALSAALRTAPISDTGLRDWTTFQLATLSSATHTSEPARIASHKMMASTLPATPLHLAVTAHLDPVGRADQLRPRLRAAAEAELTTLQADPYKLTWLADAAWRLAETDLSSQLLAAAVRHSRKTPAAHLAHCWALQAAVATAQGRWNEVHQLAAERLPDLAGQGAHRYAMAIKAQLLLVCSFQGKQQEAAALITEVRQWATASGSLHHLKLTSYAQRLLTAQDPALASGDDTPWHAGTDPRRDAVARLTHTDIIRDRLRTGGIADATAYQHRAARCGLTAFSNDMQLHMLHGEALLAASTGKDTTTALFDRAHAAAVTSTRSFDRARLALDHGKWLRRQRRPATARTHLRSAYDAFTWLQAVPWQNQARAELRALGVGTPVIRSDATAASHALSASERRIAQLAAAGMTNREIGQEMRISPRTVAANLYRIFPRLGISSRREIGRVLDSETPDPPRPAA
jgi:DNA-binding CsgD family transcriptional regulator